MKYVPMQTGMWAVFAGSFRKNLEAVFDLDPKTVGAVTAAAKKQYRRLLRENHFSRPIPYHTPDFSAKREILF